MYFIEYIFVAFLAVSHELITLTLEKDVKKSETISNRSITEKSIAWPVKRIAEIQGNLTLGGLHMVHEREAHRTCGPIMPQGGLQATEVMLYTVDIINSLNIMPKGLNLGVYILDDCDTDTYGLQQAVDFIKGSISNINDEDEYKCEDGSSPQIQNKVISGVVGASSSVTSIQVANLLKLFKIPQISFFSTSPELSNKQRFEFFSRTIPSDHYQTLAMAKIIKKLGWKYMSIVYEESNYGIKAFEELNHLLPAQGVCLAVKLKLTKDSGVADSKFYDDIVKELQMKSKAKGVIVFGSDQEVAELMKAVKRNNATGQFSWIGSDGWSARALVFEGHEAEVEGTISVQPQANPVHGFEDYFLNLTVESNKRNPWFVEFWEDHFECRHTQGLETPYNIGYKRICNGKERLTRENTKFEAQLQFVSDAVMAFAYALRRMHEVTCGLNYVGLCAKMNPIDGEILLGYLRKVNFVGLSGDRFKFNEQGDGPARYNIIHYKQIEVGVYKWVTVGFFDDDEIHLNMDKVQFKMGHPPESICSQPCKSGEMKKNTDAGCCWTCHSCGEYEVLDVNDDTRCTTCVLGTKPNLFNTVCVPIPEKYMKPDSAWAIGAISFALIGIVFTCGTLIIFIQYSDTPVVRASGRELSYVLLLGVLSCYFVTFIFMIRPTNFICIVQEFMIGLCFSIVYGSLLTKTNRISRIFNSPNQRPTFISPQSQLAICAGLVLIQIFINIVSFLISPPEAIHHYPTREDNLLVCKAFIGSKYIIAFSYPILLVVVCTIYAILTRKIPEAFNESKFIGFSMYTTCVIWLAFIPIFFATRQRVDLRITSMTVTVSLSASVTVACLFIPKLYIILLHPEKNIRQSIMKSSKVPKYFNYQGTTPKSDQYYKNGIVELRSRKSSIGVQASNTSITHSTQTLNYLATGPPISLTQEVPDVRL
ncbi:metabotropic glutamate receptor [Lepeophtheirus salmonis]|nr:metabotropic glutamate receptor-like [Lepeophtheirus salmonis]